MDYNNLSNLFNTQNSGITPITGKPLNSMYLPQVTPDDMFTKASKVTQKKYGITVPPHFLRAVHQQESSGKIDPTNYNLAMGFTPTAIEALGRNYLKPTSMDNVVQNSANYLASRAKGTLDTGEKFDLSTPENFSKWYVQRYVGVLPGKTRLINGEEVSYDKLVNSFEQKLNQQ